MAKRAILVDGDTLAYEASASQEQETQWSPWLWTLHGDLDATIATFEQLLSFIRENLDADRVIVALTDDGPRWRNRIMPEYKNHRLSKRKPITYRPLREYIHESYETFQRPGLEGDDVLGILATHPALVKGFERVVVAIDKDMRSIPGLLVNYRTAADTNDWSPERISQEEADRFHLFQTLTGDPADGYKGCPGVGPVKANKLLDADCSWATVVKAYADAGLSEAAALQNAQVARICRHTDYDFKNKEVIPWVPS